MQPSLKTRDLLALPPVERPHPERSTRVTRREVVGFLLTAGWVLAVAAVLFWLVHMVTTRPVPNVVGVEQSVAVTRLAQLGYDSEVTAVRFGSERPGTVLEQTPRGGSRGTDDTKVGLVIAAGTNAGTVPDLTGETQLYSELVLRQMGLKVMVVELVSEEPQGRVLSVKPAPGSAVKPGDSVSLTVSGYQQVLAPIEFDIPGLRVAIEPRYDRGVEVDAPYEIALRLASLLEASGARPTITREPGETTVTDREYAQRLAGADPSVYVRIAFRETGEGGVWVLSPSSRVSAAEPDTVGDLVYDNLTRGAVAAEHHDADKTLPNGGVDSVGVVLGSSGSSLDIEHFADPAWRDTVARSVYLAIGKWSAR